jgi:succinoglycan biosynthesis transport protein ExoP
VVRPPLDQNGFPGEEPGAPLREYLAVLRFRKWSILGITALVVASTLFFSSRQTPIFESEAKVLVKPVSVSTIQPTGIAPNLETERELASSVAVARLVVEALGLGEDPVSVLKTLEVTVSTNTEILLFRYGHPDEQEAQRRAQAFAESYLEFRRQQALDDLLAASASVQQRIQRLNRDLEQVNRDIAGTENETKRDTLQAQADGLRSQLAVLQVRLSDLTPAENLRVGEVVEPANLPLSPASPNHLLNGALALFVGLALGVGVAFLRERLDDRLRGRPDLEMQTGAPSLAVVPQVGSWKKKDHTPVVTLDEPKAASSEAYRLLRTGLLFAATQGDLKTVIVTSANPGEGKTVTVANLAVVLAQANKRVIALSADLRKPRLHRFFGLKNDQGLTNVLAGEVEAAKAVVRPGDDHMGVLASGPVPGNPAELLTSQAMGELLSELGKVADFVLIDVPPVLAVADALALAPFADGVILVADAEHTSRHAVAQARQQLDQVNAKLVGTVLNNFDPSRARAYPYYYQYYYQYRYEPEEPDGRGGVRPVAEAEPTQHGKHEKKSD